MLKFHVTGASLIVGAVILAVNGMPLVAALALMMGGRYLIHYLIGV